MLADDAMRGIILNFRDATDARLAEARLRNLATIHMPTGLKNRDAFEASAMAELEIVRETPARSRSR